MGSSDQTSQRIAIDPLARVDESVSLTAPTEIAAGAVLRGVICAGPGLVIHPGASLGSPAQHRIRGSGSLTIGDGVEVWDCATIHAGSAVGTGATRVGNRTLVMAYAHIGHDAILEDDVVVSNGAQIGGHVVIGRGAVLGARSALHQYVRVGRGAMVAAGSFVVSDVPPWSLVAGDRGRLLGPNRVALASTERSALVRKALRMLRGAKTTGTQLLEALGRDHQEIRDIADFIDAPSQRGICRWGSGS